MTKKQKQRLEKFKKFTVRTRRRLVLQSNIVAMYQNDCTKPGTQFTQSAATAFSAASPSSMSLTTI